MAEEVRKRAEESQGAAGQISGLIAEIQANGQRLEREISEVASVAEQSSASAEQVSGSTEQTSAK